MSRFSDSLILKQFNLSKLFILPISILISVGLSACGGGSGGSSEGKVLFTGTLTEDGGAKGKISVLSLKHGVGERIGEVEICAVGECSTTDGEGNFGFEAPSEFKGGVVEFSIVGHGIDTKSSFNIPIGVSEVVLDLRHVEGGLVIAKSMLADGKEALEPMVEPS